MGYDPDRHHRQSIRLKGYDYSRPGYYYVTICTQDRIERFGDIPDDEMNLNDAYDYVSEIMVENMLDDESIEGIGAFLQKRLPIWSKGS